MRPFFFGLDVRILYDSMNEKLICCQRAMHLPQERRVLALASQAVRSMK
jgi:hypothetical protein